MPSIGKPGIAGVPAANRSPLHTETPAPQVSPESPRTTPLALRDWTDELVQPDQRARARIRQAYTITDPTPDAIKGKNERSEMNAIGGHTAPGKILDMGGDASKGTTLTVHGKDDNPASVLPLGERAERAGTGRATFAYDDLSRRLDDNTNDLANGIRALLAKHPGAPLTVNAFSTGARMAAVALGRLEKAGALEGRDVRLNLVAPVLRGSVSSNAAAVVTWLDRRLQCEVDMGSLSNYQSELASTRLRTVKAQVYGGADDQVAPVGDAWKQLARDLTGREPIVLPGVTHEAAIAAAAALLP